MKKVLSIVTGLALGLMTLEASSLKGADRSSARKQFPVRMALAHGTYRANGKSPGAGYDVFDVHFENAGWPALEKYASTKEGMDSLAANLKNYDVVIFSTTFNINDDPKKVLDMVPYAPAFREYLENGGAFYIMDAMYGQNKWLRAIDPGLDFSIYGRCKMMISPTLPLHPTLCFPNTIAGEAGWGHLKIPPKGKWKVVGGCCGGDAASFCVASVGKGTIYMTSIAQGGRWRGIDNFENFLAFC